MFDILPNLIASILTILLPVFASYKALRTSDPVLLTPWLMYWVTFSLFTLLETYTYYLTLLIPFYAYLRLIFLFYLVLPQTQGARRLYQEHIHPFLAHHEAAIERAITHAHDQARSAGLGYVRRLVDYVKEHFLGIAPKAAPPPPPGSYAQNLLSRFNLPSARDGLAAPAGDLYGLMSAAMGTISRNAGAPREAQVEELGRSETLIPAGITGQAEKLVFLASQRERLRVVLSAMDRQASELEKGDDGVAGVHKSRSEAEFDTIDRAEIPAVGGGKGGRWMPWSWGAQADEGASSGIDISK